MSRTVIVTGPQGCGKTRLSAAIAAHFGLSRVVDEWSGGSQAPKDALVLTCVPVEALNPGAVRGCRVMQFEEVKKRVPGVRVWLSGLPR